MPKLSEYHRRKADPAVVQAADDAERLAISEEIYQAFRAQFSSAKRRKIEFNFTLEEWWDWWQTFDEEHGCIRWDRRGMGLDALVMARHGDIGPYATDNVYCATHSRNGKDKDTSMLSQRAKEWHSKNVCHLKGKCGEKHPASKPVITPHGRFVSLASAADHHGITRAAASIRVKDGIQGWHFEGQPVAQPKGSRQRITRLSYVEQSRYVVADETE